MICLRLFKKPLQFRMDKTVFKREEMKHFDLHIGCRWGRMRTMIIAAISASALLYYMPNFGGSFFFVVGGKKDGVKSTDR